MRTVIQRVTNASVAVPDEGYECSVGKGLLVLAAFIDEDTDELPLDYFIGFTITEENDGVIGEIIDVDYSTENLLFIVSHNNEQVFIPATDDFIIDIDLEKKSLTMNLPLGILDI